MFQVRLKGISSSYNGVSRVFERSFKGVSFQRCFKNVLRKFQKSFKGILKTVKDNSRNV